MTDILSKLFGSPARVKLLRLFLFNPRQSFTVAEAAARTRTKLAEAREEVQLLSRLKIVVRNSRSAHPRYGLSDGSPYILALQNLLLNAPARGGEIYERIRRAGTLKLVVVAGIFVGEWDGRLDVLIVGDRLKDRIIREKIKMLEAEVGKEVRYSALTTEDFFYRLTLNDRLVRDVFDYPHKVVHDRLDIGLK